MSELTENLNEKMKAQRGKYLTQGYRGGRRAWTKALSLDFLPRACPPLHTDSLLEPAYLGMTSQQTIPQGMTPPPHLSAHLASHEGDRGPLTFPAPLSPLTTIDWLTGSIRLLTFLYVCSPTVKMWGFSF